MKTLADRGKNKGGFPEKEIKKSKLYFFSASKLHVCVGFGAFYYRHTRVDSLPDKGREFVGSH